MIRLERRSSRPWWLGVGMTALSLLVGAFLIAVLLAASGESVISTFRSLLTAGFVDHGAFSATLVSATPLVWTGLAVVMAFSLRSWNIGVEGQFVVGVLTAAYAGLALGSTNQFIVIPAMMLAGMVGGAAWALIPGLARAYFRANEVLISLMFNYVALLLAVYLIFDSRSYLRDTSSAQGLVFPQGKHLSDNATWPALHAGALRLPLGTILALVAAAGVYVLLRRTTFGFRVRVLADAPAAGEYAGLRPRRVLLTTSAISGALAGMGGAGLLGDFSHVVDPTNLQQSSYGYTGIVVAALARLAPLAVPLTALLLGTLFSVGFQLQGPDFPLGLPAAMTGILLIVVASSEVFSRYRLRWRRSAVHAASAAPLRPTDGSEARE